MKPNNEYHPFCFRTEIADHLACRLGGFHDLRHTFATHALTSGVDAKTLSGILGHTNASFTLDTYTHMTTEMQKKASGIVGNFLDEIM